MTTFFQTINQTVADMPSDELIDYITTVHAIDGVVRLTLGEPGFAADDRIKLACQQAIAADRSHYSQPQGEPALRAAVADHVRAQYQVDYATPANVLITNGVSEAITTVFGTLLNPGDGMLVPEPTYPPYFAALTLAGGVRVTIDTSQNRFKLTPAMIEEAIAHATVPVKVLLLNYPANPTGVTYSRAELVAIAAVCRRHRLWVISDEIYASLTYEQAHTSLAEILPEQTIYVSGLSKSHALTGYRVGFIVAQRPMIDELAKVHTAAVFALPTAIQDAAVVALRDASDAPELMKTAYRQRRDQLVPQLSALGFDAIAPEGAFYLFAKLPAKLPFTGSYDFSLALAREGGVAVTPGSVFSALADDYIRISYAASEADLTEGMTRLAAFMSRY